MNSLCTGFSDEKQTNTLTRDKPSPGPVGLCLAREARRAWACWVTGQELGIRRGVKGRAQSHATPPGPARWLHGSELSLSHNATPFLHQWCPRGPLTGGLRNVPLQSLGRRHHSIDRPAHWWLSCRWCEWHQGSAAPHTCLGWCRPGQREASCTHAMVPECSGPGAGARVLMGFQFTLAFEASL